nr:afadin- and alpha-actinin-binding protein isoform X1 [Nothobranchius furzeri]
MLKTRFISKEMDEHVARLQQLLRSEQMKCSRLQQRCSHQEAKLKQQEMTSSKLRQKLSQLTDRRKEKGLFIEVLNLLPGRRAKGERPSRSLSHNAKQEEAALRLMLERREAELREAMKLRHSLTTLLHALRGDMEQFLESTDMDLSGRRRLNEAETALGEHVTGGVVQSWRTVQKKLQDALSEGPPAEGTDHYKLLVQLETELAESQQLVRFQQQLLQDSVASPLPSELSDSYFLEEWERLQMSWEEFDRQRRTFEKERQAFTDAAIRLSRERCDFGRQKASLVKQMFVCDSPLFGQRASRRESSSFNYSVLGPINISGCLPFTPSSTESGNAAVPEERLPSTPELYSALGLSYHYRSREVDHKSETWIEGVDRRAHTPWPSYLDWSL